MVKKKHKICQTCKNLDDLNDEKFVYKTKYKKLEKGGRLNERIFLINPVY